MTAADDGNRQYSAMGAIYRLYAVMGEVVMECCVYVCVCVCVFAQRTNKPSGRVLRQEINLEPFTVLMFVRKKKRVRQGKIISFTNPPPCLDIAYFSILYFS